MNNFGIDLSDFDFQNDGIVDAINFLYAGNSQYSGELWPHNSVQALQYGSVRTHYYMLTGLGTARVDLRIGTICHENGHMLCRFPDMYDYGKRDGDHEKSQGIGRYCLMGSGNQLNGQRTPSPVCAYLRELAGWPDDVVILNGSRAHVARHGGYGTVMKWETDSPNEYFLIENRSGMGLDAHLPASGLAIYHCDTLGSNEWQDATRHRHYQCALLQADGAMHLENNINAGDKDDLYAKIQGVAVSHDTTPSSRQWDDTDSGLTISDVGDAGEEIEFKMGEPKVVTVAGGETFPDLLIPDNDPKGVVSAIKVGKAGIATTIDVGVQVIHSWISDLKVILEAPDGTQAILHDNEGNDGDDIDATYRSADHSALATLVGESIEGEWRLRVIDEAQHDVGRLVRWSLAVAYEPSGKVVDAHAEPMKDIPDMNSAGISSAIEVKPSGTVREIIVTVDIEHTYIGDLQIDLVAPSGASARLHNNEGWYRNDIKRSYDLDSTAALQGMVGQSIAGGWSLAVRDLAPADVGVLKSWSLELKY